MNAGMATIEWLYHEQLKVDDEWAVRTPTGFRWWADRQAQTVEVIGQETADGMHGCLVAVRTELLRSLDLGDRELTAINAFLMPFASMAGPVFDADSRTLYLCSLVRVHEGIRQWMAPLISVASVLQIGEARLVGSELARALHAEEALSGPPDRGLRPEPDEMAEVIATLIGPMGQEPARWTAHEFREAVDKHMNGPPALLATADDAAFTVEFPYGDGSSLCQAMSSQPHPRYGNGLFVQQSFPVADMSDTEGAMLALSMNGSELAERPFGYGFGSYAYRDAMLHFTCFFPNALYRPGLLHNLYMSLAARAREMSVRLAGKDWTGGSFSPRRSVLGRLRRRGI